MDYPVSAILLGAAGTYVVATITGYLLASLGFPVQSSDRRIGCIDGLRGYLALSVLIHHFIIWMQVTKLGGTWTEPSINLFNEFGSGAVALFFMTTGFVFYPRILIGLRRTYWPGVYINRGFRIVPLIAFSVVLVTTIVAWRTHTAPDSTYPLAAAKWVTSWNEPPLLGYVDSWKINAGVLWSLWFEWIFYISILPACALAIDLTKGRAPTWIIPCILLAVCLALWSKRDDYRMLAYLPLFACGMICFECQKRERIVNILRSNTAALLGCLCFGVAVIGFKWPYAEALPLIFVFFACVACGNNFWGTLSNKGAIVLGELSYGIYLLHGIVLSLVFVEGKQLSSGLGTWQLPVVAPIVAVIVVGVTALTFLGVERPAIWMGHKLARRSADRVRRFVSPTAQTAS